MNSFYMFLSALLFSICSSASESAPSPTLKELLQSADSNAQDCMFYDAVLMIDVWGASGQETLDHQLAVLAHASNHKLPIILVEYKCKTDASICKFLGNLDPNYPFIKIQKTTTDAFFNTGMEDLLKQFGVHSLIVMGGRTNVCIRASVLSGIELGFDFISAQGLLEGGYPHYSEELDGRFRIFPF